MRITCPACASTYSWRHIIVRGIFETESTRRVFYTCPACGIGDSRIFTQVEVDNDDKLREQEIGRLVKGFAIDLEIVSTLEDITMFWDEQKSRDYSSIPLERLV